MNTLSQMSKISFIISLNEMITLLRQVNMDVSVRNVEPLLELTKDQIIVSKLRLHCSHKTHKNRIE